MGRYIVAVTGASGSVYGFRLVEQLLLAGHDVVMTATDAGREVTAYEIGFDLPEEQSAQAVLRFLELPQDGRLRVATASDLFDPIASGTHIVDAMIVAPASMGFCASVAHGLASNLVERAADVCMKEARTLVMVPRETPLSLMHLRNLTSLAEAGVRIVPAMPGFYHQPATIDDLVNHVAGKVLDIIGVEHDLFRRWGE